MENPPVDIHKILDALPAMVSYWDRDLCNRMANEAYVEFFGKSPQEMRGIHISEVLGPEMYERSLPFIKGALKGRPQVFDREIRTPSGDVRYTQASYVPDVAENGEVRGFFALVTDITERRRIEEEVERSRARLAEAEQVARLGSWEWDIATKRITCSDGFYAIYGVDRDDIDGRFTPGESQYVYPEDRDRVEQEIRQTVETGAPMDFEYRIVRPDGHVRRLHTRAELIADAAGDPLRITGTVQDVTELRAAAEVLNQTANDLGRHAAELHNFPSRLGPGEELSKLLTARQIEILILVAEGLSNSEIASRLYLGESTVKWHIRKILRALGVANRAQAVARYLSASSTRIQSAEGIHRVQLPFEQGLGAQVADRLVLAGADHLEKRLAGRVFHQDDEVPGIVSKAAKPAGFRPSGFDALGWFSSKVSIVMGRAGLEPATDGL